MTDDVVFRNLRFAASLVRGAPDLTPGDFTLPFVRILVLTGDEQDGPLTGLEGPSTGRVDMDREEEEGLGRQDKEELDGKGMRDFEGEF